jgi:hypothetical protein
MTDREGFEYIRSMRSYYSCRTPRGALLAVEESICPIPAFAYKALSVKPLFEEPYNLEELERVLAQPSLSLGDAMLLEEIFTDMTKEADKERALFAAESLGALEGKWARRVEELRPAAEDTAAEGAASGKAARPGACSDEGRIYAYARALYEYALIAGRYASIRNYYLREAYYALSEHPEACATSEGFDLRIRCLLRLGLVDQAEAIIASELGKRSDGELLLLAVEAAFERKDARRVRELLAGKDLAALELDPERELLLRGWMA